MVKKTYMENVAHVHVFVPRSKFLHFQLYFQLAVGQLSVNAPMR